MTTRYPLTKPLIPFYKEEPIMEIEMAKPVVPNMEDPSWISSLDLDQIIKLSEAATRAKQQKQQQALQDFKERVETEAQKLDVDLSTFFSRKAKGVSTKPPKYRNPDTGQTFTGKGRGEPEWLKGKNREDFLNPDWVAVKNA